MRMTTLEWALTYAEAGFAVSPLHPNRKNPVLLGKESFLDEQSIRRWWGGGAAYNIGIYMGASIFGLDIDFKDGCDRNILQRLPPTPHQKTPSGGLHAFFKMPKEGIKNGLVLERGLTVRAAGFLFAVTPSHFIPNEKETTSREGDYEWVGRSIVDGEIAECPEWILELNKKETEKKAPYRLPEKINYGNQHRELFRFASSLRAKGMGEPEITAALLVANGRLERPAPEENLSKISSDVVNRYGPGETPGVPQAWRTVADDLESEREERIRDYQSITPFGVSYLDLACGGGLVNKDLALVVAKTGAGKTEFCSTVADNVISSGKSIAMFALEAEEREISRRIKYRHLAKVYYSDKSFFPKNTYRKLNFVDWEAGRFNDLLLEEEDRITKDLTKKFSKMFVMYKTDKFGTRDLKEKILEINDSADVFILDHLGMVDSENENENKAMTDLVSTIRQIALIIKKPVIVVSHVRKTDPRFRTVLPTLEDVHGTSNLAKICTKAIILGPADTEINHPTKFPTYMRLAKFRKDGSRTRYTALINFNVQTNSYENVFQVGELKKSETEFEPITDEHKLPYWARKKEQNEEVG